MSELANAEFVPLLFGVGHGLPHGVSQGSYKVRIRARAATRQSDVEVQLLDPGVPLAWLWEQLGPHGPALSASGTEGWLAY